ncbi:MAG: hypothetical protein M5R41_19350 [Bacteroidia bacterium]|nr:hypothetical protein [Bacteroidia bacterium]
MLEVSGGVITSMLASELVEVTIVDRDLQKTGGAVGEVLQTTMAFPIADFEEAVMAIRNQIIEG